MDKINICGLDFSNITFKDAVSFASKLTETGKKEVIFPANVESIMLARNDTYLQKIYNEASILLPDGMPVVWASHFLGTPLKEKISGPDFLPLYLESISAGEYSVFIVGGEEGVAERTALNLSGTIKGLKIAGTMHGYFNKSGYENTVVIERINSSGASVLIVAMGTPLQEKWIYENIKHLTVRIAIGVGAAIDFLSGNKSRAPEWMCNNGLEWVFRLFQEPARLWKRYLVRDIQFPFMVLKNRYRKD